jgi:hypothetical protein
MCCYVDKKRTRRVRRTFKDNGGRTIMWKVLKLSHVNPVSGKLEKSLMSPYRDSVYTFGWNKSNRYGYTEHQSGDDVYRGIHVYTNKTKALDACFYKWWLVVPVIVYSTDFVAAGDDYDAVFDKVFLDPVDYDEAMEEE